MRDYTDPREEAKLKADEETKRRIALEQERDDYKWLMNDPRGRRIMWGIISACGLYRTSFHTSGSLTAFNEGQRNMGILLNDKVFAHAIDQALMMQQEARQGALNKG